MYGTAQADQDRAWGSLLRRCQPFTVRQLASASRLSVGKVSGVLSRSRTPKAEMMTRLQQAVTALAAAKAREAEEAQLVLAATRERCQQVGVRVVAQEAGVDPGHLARVLGGRRQPSRGMVMTLQAHLTEPEGVYIE